MSVFKETTVFAKIADCVVVKVHDFAVENSLRLVANESSFFSLSNDESFITFEAVKILVTMLTSLVITFNA